MGLGSTLGLLEEKPPNAPLALMVQTASRFLLEYISKDLHMRMNQHANEFDQVWYTNCNCSLLTLYQTFAIDGFVSMRCLQCKNETARRSTTHISELSYISPVCALRLSYNLPL